MDGSPSTANILTGKELTGMVNRKNRISADQYHRQQGSNKTIGQSRQFFIRNAFPGKSGQWFPCIFFKCGCKQGTCNDDAGNGNDKSINKCESQVSMVLLDQGNRRWMGGRKPKVTESEASMGRPIYTAGISYL